MGLMKIKNRAPGCRWIAPMAPDHSILKRVCRSLAALLLLGLTAQSDLGEPFGMTTETLPEGPSWVTWRNLQSQMKADERVVLQCRVQPRACPSFDAQKFIEIADEGRFYTDDDGRRGDLGRINRAVNLSLSPVKSGTKWTSPLSALAAGIGDCKQYSVLKYAALKNAGFAADDLRIVILQPKLEKQTHAVVTIRTGNRWLVLDNRTMVMADSKALLGQNIPLFALDDRGVRQFTVRIASRDLNGCEAGT